MAGIRLGAIPEMGHTEAAGCPGTQLGPDVRPAVPSAGVDGIDSPGFQGQRGLDCPDGTGLCKLVLLQDKVGLFSKLLVIGRI